MKLSLVAMPEQALLAWFAFVGCSFFALVAIAIWLFRIDDGDEDDEGGPPDTFFFFRFCFCYLFVFCLVRWAVHTERRASQEELWLLAWWAHY